MEEATSRYLNQWTTDLITHICISRPRWVKTQHGITYYLIVLLQVSYQAALREALRLLEEHSAKLQRGQLVENDDFDEVTHRSMIARIGVLVNRMSSELTQECERLGAWGILGQGTGGLLVHPDTLQPLDRDQLIGEEFRARICSNLSVSLCKISFSILKWLFIDINSVLQVFETSQQEVVDYETFFSFRCEFKDLDQRLASHGQSNWPDRTKWWHSDDPGKQRGCRHPTRILPSSTNRTCAAHPWKCGLWYTDQ